MQAQGLLFGAAVRKFVSEHEHADNGAAVRPVHRGEEPAPPPGPCAPTPVSLGTT